MNVDIAEVFPTEWPRLVAVLVRDFGDLDLAEDCAQESFAEASTRWQHDGVPSRPGAWLTTTARRKALDRIRRSASYRAKLDELEARAKLGPAEPSDGLVDDRLALLLGCCHPALGLDAQVALTLRVVAGLTTEEIARAFLVEPATMGKRLTRAKTKIRAARIPFRAVDREVLAERVTAVRHVIYLIFTEAHASQSTDSFVRGDLCDEAAWLASLLSELLPDDSESRALLALILLTDARRSTRLDDDGLPVRLEKQDRSLWDRNKIAKGMAALGSAIEIGPTGPLGLQAIIAALHAGAPTFEATDWARIVRSYDLLLDLDPSPVVALNRAGALSYAKDTKAALAEVDRLAESLSHYLYFHTARADLLRRLDRSEASRQAYARALECRPAPAERAFIERELAALDWLMPKTAPLPRRI